MLRGKKQKVKEMRGRRQGDKRQDIRDGRRGDKRQDIRDGGQEARDYRFSVTREPFIPSKNLVWSYDSGL